MKRGFTLLEVLVATAIMGIAVAGLLSNLRTSLSNASRLTEYDRAVGLARKQMDELLATRPLPKGLPIEGLFPPEWTGGGRAGWRARVTPFESVAMPGMPPPGGTRMLERIELEIWWMQDGRRRTLQVEAYRSAFVTVEDVGLFQQGAVPMGAVP